MTNREALILRLISYDTAELAAAIWGLVHITEWVCKRCPAQGYCGNLAKKSHYAGPMPCPEIIKAWLEAEEEKGTNNDE